MVAAVLVSPHTVFRPGYREFDASARSAATWQLVVFWAAIGAAIVWVGFVLSSGGWRRAAGPVVAIMAVLAGVVDAALLPRTTFGFTIMNYRWLWATGTFVLLLVLVGGQRWVVGRTGPGSLRVAGGAQVGLGVVLVVLASANLPRSVQHVGADEYLAEQASIAAALDQVSEWLDEIAASGPVVVDDSGMYFGHGYTYPLLVRMQEHDVDFRFDDPLQEHRFGSGRVSDGDETQRLRLISGDPAVAVADSSGTIAFVDGSRPVAVVLETS
jgi:hypothetical protein